MIVEVYKLRDRFDLFIDNELIRLVEDDEYLCETIYTAISPGTETAAYSGLEPLRPGKIYPRLLGYCNVAKVICIGKNVLDLKVGDIVLTFQSHRSGFKQNSNDFKIKIPEKIDLKSAVTAYLFHLGLHAIYTADFKPGNNIGIIGMGTLGVTTSLISNLCNANTTIFTNRNMLLFPKIEGVQICNVENITENQVFNLTNNIGFDIVINTSNKWEDWRFAMEICRKGGVIINLGFPGRGDELPNFNPLDPKYIYYKSIEIKPLGFINEQDVLPFEFRFNLKRNIEYILGNIESGKLLPEFIISDIIPYKQLEGQYQNYLQREKLIFSTILDWRKK